MNPKNSAFRAKPVFIFSTGRCGSTMVSEMLNRHPDVLSLSEFFVPLGSEAFAWPHPDGQRMWRTYVEQSAALHSMLKDGLVVDECLYPVDSPTARFRADNLPPIMAATLPHLSDQPDALLDELEPIVRAQPRRPLAEHYQVLFEFLARKFNRSVWVERSGGSIMSAAKLLKLFPDARVIHVYRDGRDTALSMHGHHNFNVLVGGILKCQRLGLNPYKFFLKSDGSRLEAWASRFTYRFLNIQKLLKEGASLPALGEFWSRLILIADQVFGHLPPDRLLNVKFEDLQQSPREKLQELIRFIDPALENAQWLEEVSAIPRPARSKFKSLPLQEQNALTTACAPGLQLLGYSL